MAHGPSWIFFQKTINYLLAYFIVQNFKKIYGTDPKLLRCTIIRPKIAYLP